MDDPAAAVERGFAALSLAAALAAAATALRQGSNPWDALAAASLALGLCAVLGMQPAAQVRRFGDHAVERSYRRAMADIGRPALRLGRPAQPGIRALWRRLRPAPHEAPAPAPASATEDEAAALGQIAADMAGLSERLGLQAERGACTATLLTQQAVGLTREADALVRSVAALEPGAVEALRAQAAAIAARLPAIEQAARAQNEVGQAMLHGAAVQADEVARLRAQVAAIVRKSPLQLTDASPPG